VLGVIGVNDSPTCGVTRTVDIVEYVRRVVAAGTPDDAKMREILQDTLRDGTSYSVGGIMKELSGRKLDIRVVGFEPWAESPRDEAERVVSLLGL
jgi:predicted secreted protein